MRAIPVIVALSLLGACAGHVPPVPVQGDVRSLEGRWTGEYSNLMLGRSGSIEFVLGPGVDTAQGSVLMIPEYPNQRIEGTRGPEPYSGPRLLQIQFVRIQGHRVSGRIEAYRDPESGAMLTTTFSGYLEGDVIEGKFFTVDEETGMAVEGRWRVERQP